MTRLLRLSVLAVLVSLGGCVVYEPVSVGPSPQQRFDRSWSAAAGAMVDQGVTIVAQDGGTGVIRGARGGIQVRFDQSGDTAADPGLINRVSSSYDRRMGR